MRVPAQTLRWVERHAGGRVEHARRIRRGSTEVHALDITTASGARAKLALRRFIDPERLAEDPWYQPSNEARVLEALAPTPVPAPTLVAADVDATLCDVPTLLTDLIPGRNGFLAVPKGDLEPWLRQMAEALVQINAVEDPGGLMDYEPYEDMRNADPPKGSTNPDLWRKVFALIDREPPPTEMRFIHRDYHQENTMWLRGRLTGVIDWTAACRGPIDIDLARMRQNLAGEVSVDAAERFLDLYRAVIGDPSFEPDPYWELMDYADGVAYDVDPGHDTDRFEQLVASVAAKLA